MSFLIPFTFEERLEELKELISNSKNIVFFGGAGVSTESGIPDFRSKDGLYNTPNIGFEEYEPEYLLSCKCLIDNQEVFFEFYRQKLDTRNIEPNITHIKLAKIEENNPNKNITIITQNIDNLHQKAGSKNVLELHGSVSRNYCIECGAGLFDEEFMFSHETVPRCPVCGGTVRPDVVLYGECLYDKIVDKAVLAIKKSDLFIIAGTSLSVYPAAGLIQYARNHIVVINNEKTSADRRADVVFRESLGEVFSKL